MPIPYPSIELFKAKVKLLKPYTANGKHGEALTLFSQILGYRSYSELAASDVTRGDEPTLDKALVVMSKLLPNGTQPIHRKLLDELGVLLTPDSPSTVLPVLSKECLCNYLKNSAGKVPPALQEHLNISVSALAHALVPNGLNTPSDSPTLGSLLESLIYREPESPILASIQRVEETANNMLRTAGALAVAACATGVGSVGLSVARKATSIALAELQTCYDYLETLPYAPLETLDFLSQFSEFVATLLSSQKRLIEFEELTVRIKRLYETAPANAGATEKAERARAGRALTLTLTGLAMKKFAVSRIPRLLEGESGWLKSEMMAVNLLRTIALAQLRMTREALSVARASALDRSVVKVLLETAHTPESRQLLDIPTVTQLQKRYWKRFGFDLATIKLNRFSEALRMFRHIDELYEVNPTQAHSDSPEMLRNWFSFENQVESSRRPPIYRPVNTTWKFWSHVRTGIRYIP
jgi:hypothetical protein